MLGELQRGVMPALECVTLPTPMQFGTATPAARDRMLPSRFEARAADPACTRW
jgi:hypothetical protein